MPAVDDLVDVRSAALERSGRRPTVLPGTSALFAFAAVAAAYTGFRVPNTWAVTLQTVSLQDGFHRRFLIGTLLQPVAALFHYDYWFYAAVSYIALGAVFAVLGVAIHRTRLASRRVLILAWLLLPTGTFLFNEAGYLDQFLYLALFAALWLRTRSRPIAATVVMTFTPLVHEVAALSVLPVYAMVVLLGERIRRAAALLAPPALIALTVLVVPAASAGAGARDAARLARSGWTPRSDVFDVYSRSFSQNWKLYNMVEILQIIAPYAALAIGAYLLLNHLDRQRSPRPHIVLSAAALGAPALLAFAGWDWNRWDFFVLCNLFLALWLRLGTHESDPVRRSRQGEFLPAQWAWLLVVVLVIPHLQTVYFGWATPRQFSWDDLSQFIHDLRTGTAFAILTD